MGMIGLFIDDCCKTHPHLMRDVLEKPLAPLSSWIAFDDSGQACGCLIGTAALAAGLRCFPTQMRRSFSVGIGKRKTKWVTLNESFSETATYRFLGRVIGYEWKELYEIGIKVGLMGYRFGDELTVHLMRQRIARNLAIANVPQLNEPVENAAPIHQG